MSCLTFSFLCWVYLLERVAATKARCIEFKAKASLSSVDDLINKTFPLRVKVRQVPTASDFMNKMIPHDAMLTIAHSLNKQFRMPVPDAASPIGFRRVDTFNVDFTWSTIKTIVDVAVHRARDPRIPLPSSFHYETEVSSPFGAETVNLKDLYTNLEYGAYVDGVRMDFLQSLTRDGGALSTLTRKLLTWTMKQYGREAAYDVPYDAHVWFSAGGTKMAPHIDTEDNWNCQISGVKSVTLWSPDDAQYLYPIQFNFSGDKHYTALHLRATGELQEAVVPMDKRDPKITAAVDVDDPDFVRFPKFAKAKPVQCELKPGYCMWIPGGWWHYVTSSEGNSILG